MKIIKEGDLGRVKRMRRFACRECGCVFEASASEYRVEPDYRNGSYCVHRCPTCGKEVKTPNDDRG